MGPATLTPCCVASSVSPYATGEPELRHGVLLGLPLQGVNVCQCMTFSMAGPMAAIKGQHACSNQHCVVRAAQVVIADDRQAGYFLHIWRRLSWPYPLRILRKQPFPDNTCFSKAIIAPYAAHAQSLLTYKAGSVDEVLCDSVVLQATSRWLRHLFRDMLPLSQRQGALAAGRRAQPGTAQQQGAAEAASTASSSSRGEGASQPKRPPGAGLWFRELAPLEPSPTQSAAPLELLYVVWLSRRRFEQQHAAELTAWQKARVLSEQQQEELVLGLQRAVLKWNAQTCVTAGQKDCQARHVMFSLQVGTDLLQTCGRLLSGL